jgi:hypothetical protein
VPKEKRARYGKLGVDKQLKRPVYGRARDFFSRPLQVGDYIVRINMPMDSKNFAKYGFSLAGKLQAAAFQERLETDPLVFIGKR